MSFAKFVSKTLPLHHPVKQRGPKRNVLTDAVRGDCCWWAWNATHGMDNIRYPFTFDHIASGEVYGVFPGGNGGVGGLGYKVFPGGIDLGFQEETSNELR